jgi:hypothetical protein
VGNLTFAQQTFLQQRILARTPQLACSYWRQYGYPNGNPFAFLVNNAGDRVDCSIDDNNNGQVDDAVGTSLYREDTPVESCRLRTPQGPNGPDVSPFLKYTPIRNINLPAKPIVGVLAFNPAPGQTYSFETFSFGGTTYTSQSALIRQRNRFRFWNQQPNSSTWISDLYTNAEPDMMALEDQLRKRISDRIRRLRATGRSYHSACRC